MKKIAIVNQRCGLEVNGGSEFHARVIAEKLSKKYDVEILTTCAHDYTTWKNYYKAGVDCVNGVKVRRFPVLKERNWNEYNHFVFLFLREPSHTMEQCDEWIKKHGPYSVELVSYIKNHKNDYDVFIFVTYEYYQTVFGMPAVADKSIFIPTAHDVDLLYLPIFKKVFECPKAYIFNTEEERRLVSRIYNVGDIPYVEAGVGVDIPENIDAMHFISKFKINFPFMIYVGRIDVSKGCDLLFNYFIEYKKRNPDSRLKLVLMGKSIIKIPKSNDIVNLGFVSEEDKYSGIAASKFMVMPSNFESLSISTLEAMSLSRTLIVNGRCDVLKGHCVKSNGALYYDNYFEFEAVIDFFMSHPHEKKILERNAKLYVEKNYNWDVIMRKFDDLIEII